MMNVTPAIGLPGKYVAFCNGMSFLFDKSFNIQKERFVDYIQYEGMPTNDAKQGIWSP